MIQPNLSALSPTGDGLGGPRLLVVGTPLLVKRFPDLLQALLDAGAALVFTAPRDALPPELAAHPAASSVALPLERSGPGADAVRLFRAAADLVRFLGPDFEEARWPRRRALRRLLQLAGLPWTRAVRDAAEALRLPGQACTHLRSSFREYERLLPPEPGLAAAVAGIGADAMLVLTRCALGGAEPDALKAARSAGLPSIMLVCSWDNLSAKATLNEHPDRLLVWNDVQAREAVELQDVPRDRILILGAPNFDGFFEELPSEVSRARAPGEGRAALLYLGSSPKVAPHEPAIFDRWLAAVRSSGYPALREATVVVRPHPAAARRWQEWTPPDNRVTLAAPQARIEPARLSELLLDADAVIALNTSAEIEAAIAERPVLTFRAGRRARGQEGTLHFSYLLEAKGGFVLDAATLEEHVSRLEAVLRDGYDREPMRRFVERFVRPAGLAQPVVPLVAEAILDFALAEGVATISPAGVQSST